MTLKVTARLHGFPDHWQSGREIIDAKVGLGHNEKSSACSITLADPDGAIAARLFKHSIDTLGIVGLPEDSPGSSGSIDGPVNSVEASEDLKDSVKDIVRTCLANGVTDKGQIAYILATAQHESATFTTLVEFGDDDYFSGYIGINGNKTREDAIRYKGRGYVQLTGLGNYKTASNGLGIDLVNNPDKAATKEVALLTLVVGMRDGWYTGRRLSDYVSGSKRDYIGARYVVNVQDRAALIAGYARDYEATVDKLLAEADSTKTVKTPVKSNKTQNETGEETTVESGVTTAPLEVKGAALTVTVGATEYSFVHTATEFDHEGRLVLKGQGIRWKMARRKHTRSKADTTLKDLATAAAKDAGAEVDYQADYNPEYTHVEQRGISDYQLLVREAKANGLFVSEKGGKLTVKELKNIQDTQIVYGPGQGLLEYKVSDKAVSQLEDYEGGGSSFRQEEAKAVIDPATGQLSQHTADIDDSDQPGPSGNAEQENKGTLKPGGDAIAQQYRGKNKRVKGLPTELKVVLTSSSLEIAPLSAIRTVGLPGPLSRIWLVDEVSHAVADGVTTLKVTSPIEALDTGDSSLEAGSGSGPSGAKPNLKGWVEPTENSVVTSLPRSPHRPNHRGIDIASIGFGHEKVFAANEGIVKTAVNHCAVGDRECGGRLGNYAVIAHDEGYETVYGHMQRGSVTVKPGNRVTAGQHIGNQDNTGASGGVHLHFEAYQGNREINDYSELGYDWPLDAKVG